MVRKLSWLVALLALSCSMGVYALGMGDIDLHSALNQPLNADIELTSVRPNDADSIKVLLGSVKDFERAGLERPYLLTQLRFNVVAKGNGKYRIHVSSAQAIREPFLDFLVQVTWRGGQLVREFTVLLDPPVLMPAPVQVITAPVTRAAPSPASAEAAPAAPAPTPRSAPLHPSPAPQAEAPQSAPASQLQGNSYGPVRPNETLWRIANSARPDSSISVPQMMQAILQANPGAFINNNINNLKSGQILRIPSASEVAEISAAQARAATQEQNEAWRNRRKTIETATPAPAPTPVPAPAASPDVQAAAPAPAPATEKTAPAAADEAGQLKVIAPTNVETTAPVESAGAGVTPPATSQEPASFEVQKELALANEAVETQRQATDDLRTRMTDLEKQISTMQKLMQIKDEQIAAMQSKGGAGAVDSAQATSKLSEPASLAMIGIIATLLAALVWVGILFSRKRATPLMQGAAPAQRQDVRTEPRPSPAPAPAPVSAPERAAVPAAGAVTAAAVRAASTEQSTPALAVKAEPEKFQESDPLSEADIYLAYGRYQQAEDLIKEAMHHDRNPELSLKLLEIYYAAKNTTRFEDAARDLRQDVGPDHELWQRALLMGRELCPYSLLFSDGQSDLPAEVESAPAAASTVVPDSYDFDIGGNDDTVVAPPRQAAPEPAPVVADAGYEAEPASDVLDEVGTKLDLARAYIDMGDPEGARSILDEVLKEGSAKQIGEAQELLERVAR